MTKTAIKFIILFILFVFAQAIIFNQICLFNVATPFIFIYIIVRMPITVSVNWLMSISFILGLCVDVFSDTQGMNALACTLLAAIRRPVLLLFFPREDDIANPEPSIRSFGFGIYIKYLLTLVLLFCCFIYTIEAFSFFNFFQLVMRIASSTLLTSLLLLGIDSISSQRQYVR
ncbi:MAG: rod shape-determining protein MreD [Muribaculaceae bacterium]|nr:rod shape-determining protein MreD [Muribaculaceae bacterium]